VPGLIPGPVYVLGDCDNLPPTLLVIRDCTGYSKRERLRHLLNCRAVVVSVDKRREPFTRVVGDIARTLEMPVFSYDRAVHLLGG